ncbi:hypothetical protein F8M41_015413 [Gigaspora margarita]|uniref:Uncharacterized protein n=1 Tax=Gigaspora margarita TaxID=4874 RepID=A0A8H3WXR7_GIGMA|nr:hypothetical protein F8M41_015413 [Gigaspora margarita]
MDISFEVIGEQPKNQVFLDFYKTLESVTQEQNGPEAYAKAQKLLRSKKEVTNTEANEKRSPKTDVPSKKQRVENLGIASSAKLTKDVELPDSVTRSEAYKNVEFESITTKDLLHPFKPSKITESVKDYLDKNSKPNKKSTEEEVQR